MTKYDNGGVPGTQYSALSTHTHQIIRWAHQQSIMKPAGLCMPLKKQHGSGAGPFRMEGLSAGKGTTTTVPRHGNAMPWHAISRFCSLLGLQCRAPNPGAASTRLQTKSCLDHTGTTGWRSTSNLRHFLECAFLFGFWLKSRIVFFSSRRCF